MSAIFNTLLYQPIFQALAFVYNNIAFQDLGFSIIVFTILIRLVLFPLFYKQIKSQTEMQKVQPMVKEIQERCKNDKAKQGEELMALYKEHKINPLAGIGVLLIQLPILIAIYRVIINEVSNGFFDNTTFLGFIDLGEVSIILAVIAAALQYFQVKLSLPKQSKEGKKDDKTAMMGKMMTYIAPGITLVFLSQLPAALGFYWTTSTVFGIGQQIFINKKMKKKDEEKTDISNTQNDANKQMNTNDANKDKGVSS